MSSRIRLVVVAFVFVVAVIGLSYLPIWPTSQMTRSQVVGHRGDVIHYKIGFESLPSQIRSLRYDRSASLYAYLFADAFVCLGLGAAAAALARRTLVRAAVRRADGPENVRPGGRARP